MKNEQLITKFEDYLKYERKLSSNTIISYVNDLNNISKDYDLLNLTKSDITKYFSSHKEYAKRSIAHQLTVFKTFYNFLMDEGLIKINPITDISGPRLDKKLPIFLTIEEVNQLLEVPINTIYDYRDKTMLEVLYATGLRVSELSNLKLSNIDFNDCFIRVVGKGSKERIIPINDTSLFYLKNYINDYRPQILKNHDSEYVFISNAYKNISRVAIFKMIKKNCLRAGIKKDISPHVLRHTFASHLLKNGVNLRIIQELLGHEDLTTTEIYTHLINEQLKNDYEIYHPRSHKD